MAADVARFFRVESADCEVTQLGTDCAGRLGRRRLDLFAGEVLAESRHRVCQTTGDQEARRVAADEPHGITDDIPPEPGAGAQRDRIVHTRLDIADPMSGWGCGIDLTEG